MNRVKYHLQGAFVIGCFNARNFLKQILNCLFLYLQRVMSDEDGSSDESEGSQWDDDGEDGTGDEEEEDENGSEEYFSTDSEESESSSHSDWESLGEIEEGSEGVNYSPVEPCAASTVNTNVSKACDGGTLSSSSSKAVPPAAYLSDSSDGQSEKCPICLRNFTDQEIGTPEACDHSFCVDCLQEWSRNVNTCPVDRQVFTLILVRRVLEGKVIRRIPVEPPRQHNEEELYTVKPG